MSDMINVNNEALNCLINQRWIDAQKLFFYNAKVNPSHETYNNLGFYLISEGLECQNGKTRNSNKLGLKYLLKAYELKKTSTNLCAIAYAYNYQLKTSNNEEYKNICSQMARYFEDALQLEKSDEIYYNFLLATYLTNPHNSSLSFKAQELIERFTTIESILLALSVSQVNGCIDSGIKILNKYNKRLDCYDNLLFYTKFGMYQEGYDFCSTVLKQFSLDEVIFACMLECCINTSKIEEAQYYWNQGLKYGVVDKRSKKKFESNLTDSFKEYRKAIIDNYIYTPPIITNCCYFGCPIHH